MTDPKPISCLDCQSQLVEFALDELPEQSRAQVAEHLENGCTACSEQLSEVLNGFAKLAYALPTERPTARVENELLRRIGAQNRTPVGFSPAELRTDAVSAKTSMRRLAAVAIALAASLVGVALWSNWSADRTSSYAGRDEWAEVQRRVARANASEHFSAIPQLKFASSRKPAADSKVEGYVVVDQLAKQWHVYAFHLPSLAPGRQYYLWFDLGESHFGRAGVANVDDEGTLTCLIDVPDEVVDPKGLAISDEAETAPERPTGENFVEAPLR